MYFIHKIFFFFFFFGLCLAISYLEKDILVYSKTNFLKTYPTDPEKLYLFNYANRVMY